MNAAAPSSSMRSLIATILGSFLAILAFAVARELGAVDSDAARRVVAIGFGVMLIVIGNVLPKLVRPLRAHGNDASRVLAADRFAGRTLVLAGIAFIALWALAPADHVMRISALAGLAAFGLVAVSQIRLAFRADRRGRSQPTAADADASDSSGVAAVRLALLYLLHGLLWVLAMFLADSVWGDRAAPWLIVGFVLANSVLVLVHLTRHRGD